VWRGLGQLQCLRLLMLGHVHSDLLPSEGGRVLPRIAGITRLELCSAFGGRPEYAATYSIAEDPALWQEQVRRVGGTLWGRCRYRCCQQQQEAASTSARPPTFNASL
jgi:hypothetical protein